MITFPSAYVIPGLFSANGVRSEVVTCIKMVVCQYFKIPYDELSKQCKKEEYTIPRQYAMYLCFYSTRLSLKRIGDHFGGRDHATVIHSIRKVHDRIAYYQEHRNHLNALWDDLAKDKIEKQHRIIKLK